MQRSSESIGALATALAKAQAELVNPEKSLVGMIRADRPGQAERKFRYAPLASGLDIIRKTLGRHEIAIFQTTGVDQASGTISLSTMLTHASGEWIASDWPVCQLADLAMPHRMGAALTYARRYALFTLVGIAGEDDLDAPDLQDTAGGGQGPRESPAYPGPGQRSVTRTNGRTNGKTHSQPVLDPASSAERRDQLLADLVGVPSADEAITWAEGNLKIKNLLGSADAQAIESAFAQKLASFAVETDATQEGAAASNLTAAAESAAAAESSAVDGLVSAAQENPGEPPMAVPGPEASPSPIRGPIDKSELPIAEPRRYRNKAHLKFVAAQPCLVCGKLPSDPHHVGFAQPRALSRKVSDEYAVPLCRSHHRALHRRGNEAGWWREAGIDPIKAAQKLWRKTRLNGQRTVPAEGAVNAADQPASATRA